MFKIICDSYDFDRDLTSEVACNVFRCVTTVKIQPISKVAPRVSYILAIDFRMGG